MKIKKFRDLEVWKLGKEIVVDVYRTTTDFPEEEMYGLVSQSPRAAVFIPSNLAEGFSRKHNPEYRQLLCVTLGSCAELETQIEVADDLDFLLTGDRGKMLEKLDHESRMLKNLIKRL